MRDTVETTFHVQIEPLWSRYRNRETGEYEVVGAKMARATLNRPETPKPGTVSVQLTIRLPKTAFLPLRPEAVIEIPTEMILANPVEVIAEQPEEPA